VGPQRPDLRTGRRAGIRARFAKAEINLLDGGHFLLASRLAEVVALIGPFLEDHLARVAESAVAV
jgi:surfactin synthase thioesterase subunit